MRSDVKNRGLKNVWIKNVAWWPEEDGTAVGFDCTLVFYSSDGVHDGPVIRVDGSVYLHTAGSLPELEAAILDHVAALIDRAASFDVATLSASLKASQEQNP